LGPGTYSLGQNFTLQAGECEVVWETTPGTTAGFNVRVTQTGVPAMVDADSAVGYRTEGGAQTSFIGATLLFAFRVNSDHAGRVRFYNSSVSPTPEPVFITVCKVGPPGVYNYTGSVTGPNPGTFLNGTNFTVAAGQCVQAYQSAPPIGDPDPANYV